MSINRDLDRRIDEVDELEEDEGLNRYLPHLPKTIWSAAVHALVSMLHSGEIESRVNEIEAKYANYKLSLNKKLKPNAEFVSVV